ncbi:MAG: ABC transporter ATP-binding protein [Paracoccaceae bacterium]
MTAALEIRNLVKLFGGLKATNDLSFSVAQGESLGLIGPNGAGKTTVFSQIMGELRQSSGTIRLFGEEISRLPTPARIRHGVSRTYQVPRPFAGMSVAQNIRVGLMPNSIRQMVFRGPDTARERALGLSVGLSEADLDKTPAELSMGDLRKLELARTMATAPKVMLLDEVFAGLTVGEIAQVSGLIRQMRRDGMTFLIVSHDLPALEPLVDRCVAIDRGALIAEGSFAEVVDNPEVRASYLGGV